MGAIRPASVFRQRQTAPAPAPVGVPLVDPRHPTFDLEPQGAMLNDGSADLTPEVMAYIDQRVHDALTTYPDDPITRDYADTLYVHQGETLVDHGDGTVSIDGDTLYTKPGTDAAIATAVAGAAVSGVGYVYNQSSAASVWVITHPFGRLPIVSLYDAAGNEFDADVAVTNTTATVTLSLPVAGKAVLT